MLEIRYTFMGEKNFKSENSSLFNLVLNNAHAKSFVFVFRWMACHRLYFLLLILPLSPDP